MTNDKLKSLIKAWGDVKVKIEDCIKDKNIAEQKVKVMNFIDKARGELSDVIEKDLAPLLKEGKKEFNKLQQKIEGMVYETKKKTGVKKTKSKKKVVKKTAKKK